MATTQSLNHLGLSAGNLDQTVDFLCSTRDGESRDEPGDIRIEIILSGT